MNKVNKFQYWLLENNFDQAAFKSVPRNRVSVTETPVSAAITEVYASEIPQKKSKVNESKENKSGTHSLLIGK